MALRLIPCQKALGQGWSITRLASTAIRVNISKSKEREVKQCLVALNLDSNDIDKHSTKDVKSAYLTLARKYHPDSSSSSSNREEFEAASAAYNTVAEFYKTYTPTADECMSEVEDITDEHQRITPQHRQYLEYQGVGYGTPSQRKHQYDKWRADKANERVFEYRRDAMLRNDQDSALVKQEREHKYTRRIKTSNLLLRMADDMIKESMANGEFDNLEGTGKPLKSSSDHNPYVDAHTHKLNSVLMNNGFTPEWMNLEHEIKSTYKKLKEFLEHSCMTFYKKSPNTWNTKTKEFRSEVDLLNKRIDKLNMIVPSIRLQMAHFNADIGLSKVLDKIQQ